eukprot:4610078-Pyramimonas_sp.AAC.2
MAQPKSICEEGRSYLFVGAVLPICSGVLAICCAGIISLLGGPTYGLKGVLSTCCDGPIYLLGRYFILVGVSYLTVGRVVSTGGGRHLYPLGGSRLRTGRASSIF